MWDKSGGDGPAWISDSGANKHETYDQNMFMEICPIKGFVQTAGSEKLNVAGVGKALVAFKNGSITLDGVLYVPDLKCNIVSVFQLTQTGARVTFEKEEALIKMESGFKFQGSYNRNKGTIELFVVNHLDSAAAVERAHKLNQAQKERKLWHERLGHPGRDKTNLLRKGMFEDIEAFKSDFNCQACHQAKSASNRKNRNKKKSVKVLSGMKLLSDKIFYMCIFCGSSRTIFVRRNSGEFLQVCAPQATCQTQPH